MKGKHAEKYVLVKLNFLLILNTYKPSEKLESFFSMTRNRRFNGSSNDKQNCAFWCTDDQMIYLNKDAFVRSGCKKFEAS